MSAVRDVVRDWRADALCAQVDPELFFPTAERGALYETQVTAAKRVCAGCPVRTRCQDYAVAALPDGIAGGTTPEERAELRRRGGMGEPATGLVELMPPGTARERTSAGRAAAAAGAGASELMARFGVARGTAQRWCAEARHARPSSAIESKAAATSAVGEGSPAATGLPSGSSQHVRPWQATEHWKDTEGR